MVRHLYSSTERCMEALDCIISAHLVFTYQQSRRVHVGYSKPLPFNVTPKLLQLSCWRRVVKAFTFWNAGRISTTGSSGKDNRHRNTTCVVLSLLHASVRPSFLSRFISACPYNGTSNHLRSCRRQTPQVTSHSTQYANVAVFLYFRLYVFCVSRIFHVSHFPPLQFCAAFSCLAISCPAFSAPPGNFTYRPQILRSAPFPVAHGKRSPTKLFQRGGGKWRWCEPNKVVNVNETIEIRSPVSRSVGTPKIFNLSWQ